MKEKYRGRGDMTGVQAVIPLSSGGRETKMISARPFF